MTSQSLAFDAVCQQTSVADPQLWQRGLSSAIATCAHCACCRSKQTAGIELELLVTRSTGWSAELGHCQSGQCKHARSLAVWMRYCALHSDRKDISKRRRQRVKSCSPGEAGLKELRSSQKSSGTLETLKRCLILCYLCEESFRQRVCPGSRESVLVVGT